MQSTIYSAEISWLRSYVFRIALIFSVFAFSGYSNHVQADPPQTEQAELVEPSFSKLAPSIKRFQRSYNEVLLSNVVLERKSLWIWKEKIRGNLLSSTYKSYRAKYIFKPLSQIQFFGKFLPVLNLEAAPLPVIG